MTKNGVDLFNETFSDVVEKAANTVVVDVWAPWCGPCKMVGPALERIHDKDPARFDLAYANLEDFPEAAERLDVKATPTLIIFRHGKELARRSGAMIESQIASWLEQNLPKPSGS